MKSKLFLPLLFVYIQFASTQQMVNTSGGKAIGSMGDATYSVGQVFYISSESSGGSEAQGVQIAYEIFDVTGFEHKKGLHVKLSVYPNPTSDKLILKIEKDHIKYTGQIFDLSGQKLLDINVINNQTQLNLSDYCEGVYILKVNQKEKTIKEFKIIKNP